jgi:hypothetical protein
MYTTAIPLAEKMAMAFWLNGARVVPSPLRCEDLEHRLPPLRRVTGLTQSDTTGDLIHRRILEPGYPVPTQEAATEAHH